MNGGHRLPNIRMAEVFVEGNCVGFLSDVKLSRAKDGGFRLEGDWSGFPGILGTGDLYTISIPRYEFKFLSDSVEKTEPGVSERITFKDASFIPEGPEGWLETFGEKA